MTPEEFVGTCAGCGHVGMAHAQEGRQECESNRDWDDPSRCDCPGFFLADEPLVPVR